MRVDHPFLISQASSNVSRRTNSRSFTSQSPPRALSTRSYSRWQLLSAKYRMPVQSLELCEWKLSLKKCLQSSLSGFFQHWSHKLTQSYFCMYFDAAKGTMSYNIELCFQRIQKYADLATPVSTNAVFQIIKTAADCRDGAVEKLEDYIPDLQEDPTARFPKPDPSTLTLTERKCRIIRMCRDLQKSIEKWEILSLGMSASIKWPRRGSSCKLFFLLYNALCAQHQLFETQ